MKLSAFFTLEELTQSDYAERNGIDNSPPEWVVKNLRRLAISTLDPIRGLLGRAVYVTSGYRCEALERALTWKDFERWCLKRNLLVSAQTWKEYFARKRHARGLAADIKSPEYGTPFQVCQAIAASDIKYDQLIYEYSWTHVGLEIDGDARDEELTLMADGHYEPGIIERA